MKPLLSIIIPTKNRYKYLESCLRALSTYYSRPEVEIIITDNSSHKEHIESLSLFSNINYTFIGKPISQVENFEKAMSKVTGEYVTMIGDDDGMCSRIIDVVKFMKKNNYDALNSPFVSYFWPDIITKNRSNNFSGKIFFKSYSYSITRLKASSEITKCLSLGATSLCNLPRMYYGIIRKDVLDRVKSLAGEYFPGPSPDMANAFSSAMFVNNFVYFDAPLFIAGNSAKSAAGMGLAGKHVSEIEGNPQLPKDCHLQWTPFVPKYWSGPTIWTESAVQVLHRIKRNDLENRMNYLRLYASCLVFNPEYKVRINEAIARYTQEKSVSFGLRLKVEILEVWMLRFKFFAMNILNKYLLFNKYKVYEIIDIEEASLVLLEYEAEIKKVIVNGKR